MIISNIAKSNFKQFIMAILLMPLLLLSACDNHKTSCTTSTTTDEYGQTRTTHTCIETNQSDDGGGYTWLWTALLVLLIMSEPALLGLALIAGLFYGVWSLISDFLSAIF